jgi:outer membrane protein assembly factor BamB
VNINTGNLAWRTTIPFDKVPNDIHPFDVHCPGDIFLLDRIGTTISVDPASHSVYILGLPNDLVNPSGYYYLIALDKDSGQLLWHNNKYISWLGEAVGFNIYTQPEFGLVQAYDAETQELIWENDQVLLVGLVGSTGDVIIGITDDNPNWIGYSGFVGLDATTGELLWELEEDQVAPGLVDDTAKILFNHFVYSRSNEKKLIFIDPNTGLVETEINLEHNPANIRAEGNYIFVNDGDDVIIP